MNEENEFLNLPGLRKYHGKMKEYIETQIQNNKSDSIGYSDDTTYEPLEEVT